ncbi:MAG: hypothetical protein RMJ15_04080 [Nitrososphaerota archaeon]|nr:hypothetical protein [Nitrososphaerota archaeon]
MDKKKIIERLDGFLTDIPWRYKILEGAKSVEFTNVEIRSNIEKEFLQGLDEEGSGVVLSTGQFSYVINRKNGKLFASLADNNGRIVEELGEVTEKEVLEVWREQSKKRDSLTGILNLFRREEKREPVSNILKIRYELIESITREEECKSKRKSVVVLGEGFRVELRWDGGCRLYIE